MEPVKKSEAPDYYEIIRFPIGQYAQLLPKMEDDSLLGGRLLSSSSFFCVDLDLLLRPEDHDGKTEEQILCDQETFHCRPAANHLQLS